MDRRLSGLFVFSLKIPMKKEDILNKKFRRAFRGYDMQEVDAFLDEIIADSQKQQAEHDLMIQRIKALLGKIDALQEGEGSLRK